MKKVIITIFLDYYFIGTIFLILYLLGNLTIKPKGKVSKFKDKFVIYGLCFYWPLLIYYLWKGRDKNENTK